MTRPICHSIALSTVLLCMALAPAPPAQAETTDEAALTDPGEWIPIERARSRSSRRSSSGTRFHASLGGGVAAGNLWMDYRVKSTYQEDKDGLVQDDEERFYYFLAKPMLDLEVGVSTAGDRLVLGFHVGVTGMAQRMAAEMIAEWANGSETTMDQVNDRRYAPAMVLIGLGGHYVFLPDRKFTPLLGARFGIGLTWDADLHLIDAWKKWHKSGDADIDNGLYYRYRVPVRGGLDLGVRYNISDSLGVALHVPVEAFATHGYLRGVILGANLRLVVHL